MISVETARRNCDLPPTYTANWLDVWSTDKIAYWADDTKPRSYVARTDITTGATIGTHRRPVGF